jgi:DnaK suppressor protein
MQAQHLENGISVTGATDSVDLQLYKRLLLEKRRALSPTRGFMPAAGGCEGDVIDQANADVEAELQIFLQEADNLLLRAIDDALSRIEMGTYGVCVNCRQPIPRPRLEAVPWTRLCRACKETEDGDRVPTPFIKQSSSLPQGLVGSS